MAGLVPKAVVRSGALLLAVGVVARAMSLGSGPGNVAPTSELQHDVVLQQLKSGELEADAYCFDPQTPVILSTGPDGGPGIAGKDDNANGEIDERRETGAVGTDDQCLGPVDEGYAEASTRPDAMVISRGTHVPCDSQIADRWMTAKVGWVIGQLGDRSDD